MVKRFGSVFGAAAALAVLSAAAAVPAHAGVVDCNTTATATVVISSARNMSCKQAATEMRRYKGSISRSFSTPGGFRCRRVSGGELGGQWRCMRDSRAFRFEFGD